MNALIIGATGATGKELQRLLLESPEFQQVKVITRREIQPNLKLVQLNINFDDMEKHGDFFDGVDVVFCCMGTTRGQVKNQNEYRRIDHDYPVTACRLAREHGVRHALVVTSLGSNRQSSNTYLRLKAEIEDDVAALGIPSVSVFRPSFIVASRSGARSLEHCFTCFTWLCWPCLHCCCSAYESITSAELANGMFRHSIAVARSGAAQGFQVINGSARIKQLAV